MSGKITRAARPADNFAQISNSTLADPRLSWAASGILAYLLSRPIGWSTTGLEIWKARSGNGRRGQGRDAVFNALRELEEFGYLVRKRSRVAGEWVYEQEVYDQPVDKSTEPDVHSGSPGTNDSGVRSGLPGTATQEIKTPRRTINTKTKTRVAGGEDLSPTAPVDKSAPPKPLPRPRNCIDHQDTDTPPACGRCADARRVVENAEQDKTTRPPQRCAEHNIRYTDRDQCPFCPGGRLYDREAS